MKTIGTQYNSKPTDCNTCQNARKMFHTTGWVPCADCRPEEYAEAKRQREDEIENSEYAKARRRFEEAAA